LRAEELGGRFPKITVEMDRIFIADGPVWTSAGMTVGIDLALGLIERDLGQQAARGGLSSIIAAPAVRGLETAPRRTIVSDGAVGGLGILGLIWRPRQGGGLAPSMDLPSGPSAVALREFGQSVVVGPAVP